MEESFLCLTGHGNGVASSQMCVCGRGDCINIIEGFTYFVSII